MLLLRVAAPQQFAARSPAEQVKDTLNRVLSIVREHPPSETAKPEAMARRSLGSYWRDLTPQQQKEAGISTLFSTVELRDRPYPGGECRMGRHIGHSLAVQ